MNETLKTIHSMRSIHGEFSNREIADEDLDVILAASVRAANASARQSYSIVVVKDKALMKKVGWVGSRMLVFCVDYTRLVDAADALGYSFENEGLVSFVTGSTDTILAAQTAAIAAKSLGIDSLFTNCVHRGDVDRIYKLLDLPEKNCFPLIALVLGYPDGEPGELRRRITGPGVIHHGKYRRMTGKELSDMNRAYDEPESGFLTDTWREEGFAHYLEWFFEVWSRCRKKEDPEGSEGVQRNRAPQLTELARRAGFLPGE